MCNGLLHDFGLGPRLRKRTHVLQVTRRKPLHVGKCRLEIGRKPSDHPGAPTLLLLTIEDIAADLPIQSHEFVVHGHDRALTRAFDAPLELREPVAVIVPEGVYR